MCRVSSCSSDKPTDVRSLPKDGGVALPEPFLAGDDGGEEREPREWLSLLHDLCIPFMARLLRYCDRLWGQLFGTRQ